MIRQANMDDWNNVSDISARAGYDDYINAHHGPAGAHVVPLSVYLKDFPESTV